MKRNTTLIISFALLVLACSLYRVWGGRPFGFAPQLAMAVFGGAIIRDKKWSFLMPLASMLLSDAFYQLLYIKGLTPIAGFYEGQAINYVLIVSMTVFGFLVRNFNVNRILLASLAAPTAYFLLSNFQVWISGGGWNLPKTFAGLMTTYELGLSFYRWSLLSTLAFSALFFGAWYGLTRKRPAFAL